jgi:DNA-directed RNA polymerase subunit N (RpoN/RPB10)
MLVPIRCHGCGKLTADKVAHYQRRLRELKPGDAHPERPAVFDGKTLVKTPEAVVLDELGLTRYCCRSTMLTSVSLVHRL